MVIFGRERISTDERKDWKESRASNDDGSIAAVQLYFFSFS